MRKKRIFTTMCIAVGVATLFTGCSNKTKSVRPSVSAAPESSTTVPTTTVIPSTTTTVLPETTTTTFRRITTTTTEPEPEVQGKIEIADTNGVSLSDPDMGKWRQIALCEMPGPGGVPSEPWGAHWSFKASRFSGALGIANTSWVGAGGGKYGPTAGHATWQQQIEIARVIRDRYGYSAWGCG